MRDIFVTTTLAIALASSAGAQTIHRFSLPDHTATCGIGIAKDRTVVGDNPNFGVNGQATDAFVHRKGAFTFPNPPVPPGYLEFTGINLAHDIVASDFITSGAYAGTTQSFLITQGTATQITWSGAMNVDATGINDAGTMVGGYQNAANGPLLGFIDKAGQITTLQNPAGQTLPAAISQDGNLIAGSVLSSSYVFSAWIYHNGAFAAIAPAGATDVFASGVNNAGKVSGTYVTGTSPQVSHGFLYQAGVVTSFDVPGAAMTQLGGINEQGVVTGCYTDAKGNIFGFTAKP